MIKGEIFKEPFIQHNIKDYVFHFAECERAGSIWFKKMVPNFAVRRYLINPHEKIIK